MPNLVAGNHVNLVESGTDLFVHARTLVGAAASTDANGNPTPDVAVYDPAVYQGYVFKATSYPAAVAGGSMEFHSEETSPGVWAWVWRWGSYRASNGNGNYQRFADGTQECWARKTATYISATLLNGAWTYPAAFAVAPHISATDNRLSGVQASDYIHARYAASSRTATGVTLEVYSGSGTFVSTDEADVDTTARGNWQ
jgi:hypothetical protein